VTTAAGTFARTPTETVASTGGAQIMVIAGVNDATGGDPTVSTGTGDFSGGVPSSDDQLNGIATVRATSTGADEGTCDFTVGGSN
jgi:hypothetical protein